ncbi:MAG: polysaccharide biosynthesis/export family protein, partial [Paramuribaculum sp.]|nr:polysaccharide biosynthesis/export family protein [Paramuribaculum sp.]
MLKISVSCKNPELAAPFNVGSGGVRVAATGQVTTDASTDNVYRVNSDGDINFPVLGVIHVGGMSLTDASELIRDKIIAGNYIKDPIVSIEFKNFHYTVLGAVGGNGTYRVDGDKVTILEAIANAGDLSANADLERIAVIREAGGQRKIYTVDIRSTDIFNSPAFYLAQNDIVYARPKKPKSGSDAKLITWITVALSAVTAACSVIWATRR